MGSITRSFANNILAAGKFDGTKLTGDIPEANLSANAPAFDDNKIVNDLSTLGLRVHTQENLAASNTNSQYVDVFQDSTGYTNGADTARTTDEYVATTYQAVTEFQNDSNTVLLYHFNNSLADSSSNNVTLTNHDTDHAYFNSSNKKFGTHSLRMDGDANQAVYTPALDGVDNAVTSVSTGAYTLECWIKYTGRSGTDRIFQMDNTGSDSAPFTSGSTPALSWGYNDNYLNVYGRHGGNHNWDVPGTATGSNYTEAAFQHHALERDSSGNLHYYIDGVFKGEQSGWGQSLHQNYIRLVFGNRSGTTSEGFQGYIDEFRYSNVERYNGSNFTPNQVSLSNATGNFSCPAITAGSATTKMGAVITYQDNAGTNALNTDIVLQLSADNGSNFSTATLTALPDFASGIKCAKVNDLPVTAGTQLKYKITFANQGASSKEARIRGVSLNY